MKQLLMIALLLFAATSARADDRDKARAAFRLGSQHYSLGEYKEALAAFKEAYRSYEDPSFLFNIAQCHRQLDQRAEAIREYRMYLVQAPNATNRDEVRQLIARLEREVAEERATKSAPPPGVQSPSVATTKSEQAAKSEPAPVSTAAPAPSLSLTATAPPRHETPTYKKWWVWTLVGVAVAGGAAAGLAVGLTRSGGSVPTANTTFGTANPF
jgi:tetratricopeptide (TPR) repeat protein